MKKRDFIKGAGAVVFTGGALGTFQTVEAGEGTIPFSARPSVRKLVELPDTIVSLVSHHGKLYAATSRVIYEINTGELT